MASVAQLDAPSDWRPGGRGFNPRWGRQHSFIEIDHEIFSTVILSLALIQDGQLSVSNERIHTILVNRLEDWACPVNVWLGKLTALDMTPLGWLGRKTSTQTKTEIYEESFMIFIIYIYKAGLCMYKMYLSFVFWLGLILPFFVQEASFVARNNHFLVSRSRLWNMSVNLCRSAFNQFVDPTEIIV